MTVTGTRPGLRQRGQHCSDRRVASDDPQHFGDTNPNTFVENFDGSEILVHQWCIYGNELGFYLRR